MSKLKVKRNHLNVISSPHADIETGQRRDRIGWASPEFRREIKLHLNAKFYQPGQVLFNECSGAMPAINSREFNRRLMIKAAGEKL